jgi:predicted nucleic-acid-binding protein
MEVVGAESAWRAVRIYEEGKADFAHYLIGLSNQDEKAEVTYPFDRIAAESGLFRLVAF